MAVKMVDKFNIFGHLNADKIKLLELLIDLLANLTTHKTSIEALHNSGITGLIIMLLETCDANDLIMNACIDAIDGMCQVPSIESHIVHERNLPFILIDILKTQENEKTITKSTRLIANLTIHSYSIPAILKANLLSILGNVVMPTHFNKKLESYISKSISRICSSNQPIELILKSGYLDCLVRLMEVSEAIEDSHIDIMLFYAKSLPNFLNKRAFMCLIRVLTNKPVNKELIEKSIRIFKILLSMPADRDEEDLVVSGSVAMYEKLLPSYPLDILYLLGSHCLRSRKLRQIFHRK